MIGHNTVKHDTPILNTRNWNNINNRKFIIGNDQIGLSGFEKIDTKGKTLKALDICKYLHDKKIQSVIIEGGRFTLNKFIEENIWDEVRVFKADAKIIDGIHAPKPKSKYYKKTKVGKDTLYFFKNY